MKRALTLIAVVGVLAAGLSIAVVQARGVSHESAPVVGGGRIGEALEFLGTADQTGNSLLIQGYLNHVSGLPDASLFYAPARGGRTTKFPFTSIGKIGGRYVQGNVIVTTSTQVLKITYKSNVVATLSVHFQDILNVQGPNTGIATGSAWAVQTKAATFQLGTHTYRFGSVGLNERLFITGEGKRTLVTPLKSESTFAGNATVIS